MTGRKIKLKNKPKKKMYMVGRHWDGYSVYTRYECVSIETEKTKKFLKSKHEGPDGPKGKLPTKVTIEVL
jgi:macrodomain Ter protein organizer (MatP/YcbG family)